MNDLGKPVDWFFLYKIPSKGTASDGSKPTGTAYVYFDATGKKLSLSADQISDPKKGAVSDTLNQIYNNLNNPDFAWFFYNDENPITGVTDGVRGHTKGVLCCDFGTDSAFWLVDSAPKFPPHGAYGYPHTATDYAQTFLCITLKDCATAEAIADQMFVAQQPNVYDKSAVPAAIKGKNTSLESLLNNKVTTSTKAYANYITFKSKAGMAFSCFAKNKFWNTANDDDFYNDLVGPQLAENLDVETWEHGQEPGPEDSDKIHTVVAMKEVDLAPLGIKPSYKWGEADDHAKLAITAKSEPGKKYICVGDINFTKSMEKRSGGTVAFICDPLWQEISSILSAVNVRASSKIKNSKKVGTSLSKAATAKGIKEG
ncbi:putative deoxyribonuclease-2 [Puia dinghuensis]|uniref:Putative deoxyribonuclease-2 n=2 Tax=Puia dinghuensis TaxID=1792502 RepID=A0A8J2UEE0_9BACT|nr:putative deoxyribonuclease-2 [Puia dinghuensis]